jgi:hypothetical protein
MELESEKETFQVNKDDLIICGDAVTTSDQITNNLCSNSPVQQTSNDKSSYYDRVFARYPSDGQGYMQSLACDDFGGIKETLDRYGFVVVRDIISPEQCAKSVQEFFDDVNR